MCIRDRSCIPVRCTGVGKLLTVLISVHCAWCRHLSLYRRLQGIGRIESSFLEYRFLYTHRYRVWLNKISGDIDEEVEDDIKELKESMITVKKNMEVLTEDLGKKLTLISEKMNSLGSVRSQTPPQTLNISPRKLPLPRNNRPRSNNMWSVPIATEPDVMANGMIPWQPLWFHLLRTNIIQAKTLLIGFWSTEDYIGNARLMKFDELKTVLT